MGVSGEKAAKDDFKSDSKKETELKTGSKIEKNLKNIQDINQF